MRVARPTVTPSGELGFRQRADVWAKRAGVIPPTIVVRAHNGFCAVGRSGERVYLVADPLIVMAPADIQDRILAHEFAHVIIDKYPARRTLVTASVIGGLALIAMCAALPIWFITERGTWALMALGVVMASIVALVILTTPIRRVEFAADRLAAQRFGIVFDTTLSRWLKSAGHGTDPGIGWDVMFTHPAHRRRIRAARRSARGSGRRVVGENLVDDGAHPGQ